MSKCRVDTVIVGAAVVGIAVARCLSASGRNLFVLEKHSTFGNETSSRNSEVIHSGIYLKSRLCKLGMQMLYDYCQALGGHLTLDMSGAGRFGPDLEWIKQPNYRLSCRSSSHFYREIRKYWPTLPENSLIPGNFGVRPELVQNGKVLDDFLVQGPEFHGIDVFVNLLGIEYQV